MKRNHDRTVKGEGITFKKVVSILLSLKIQDKYN